MTDLRLPSLIEAVTYDRPTPQIGPYSNPSSPWASDAGQRCLIPAARFAEAVGERGRMTETWQSVKGQPLFAWAGLWRPSDEWGDCYTGVITDNALDFAHIHDRCPVILEPHDWNTWLTAPLPDLYGFDRPYPAERMNEEAMAKLAAENQTIISESISRDGKRLKTAPTLRMTAAIRQQSRAD